MLTTPDEARRPAGFKTGTTNDFRDVSGFGYVPGSLTTGVWMNNNQEPMSNEISGGLFSADGPLFLAGVHAACAEQPVGLERAACGQMATSSRRASSRRTSAGSAAWPPATAAVSASSSPFLEGTVPPLDNVHFRGCLDLEAYVAQATPDRPDNWIVAADTWSDRLVNDEGSGRSARSTRTTSTSVPSRATFGERGWPPDLRRARGQARPSPSLASRLAGAAAAKAAARAAARAADGATDQIRGADG